MKVEALGMLPVTVNTRLMFVNSWTPSAYVLSRIPVDCLDLLLSSTSSGSLFSFPGIFYCFPMKSFFFLSPRALFVSLLVIMPAGLSQLLNDWEPQNPWEAGELNCEQGLREFNPITQKRKYIVGIYATDGVETAYQDYNLTFQDYLNEVVGKRFEPTIEFSLTATHRPLRDWLDKGEEIDFMYTDTGIYSCIGTEVGAQALATTVARLKSRGREYELDMFAGTMMVLANNREINSVADLKDKVIAAGNFFDFAGAQAQFYVMDKNGVDFVVDPKQVIFTANNRDTVQGILDGRWDVGFVRTGQVERTINPATGDFIDPDLFKVIGPRIHIMDDGTLFPFLHTTPVFPEWPLAARNHVDRVVSEEVAAALINFGSHARIGEAIDNCREKATTSDEQNVCDTMPPTYFDPKARCDTTRELAELAFMAGKAGFHSNFRPPKSHFEVRTMQQDAGFIIKDEYGDWHCERADTLYDGIFCPEGHFKVRRDEFSINVKRLGNHAQKDTPAIANHVSRPLKLAYIHPRPARSQPWYRTLSEIVVVPRWTFAGQ